MPYQYQDIAVTVVTRARQSQIVVEKEGQIKVKLKAAPAKGQANTELVKLLSQKYSVAQSSIEIRSGLTARKKLVRIYFKVKN